MHSVSIRTVFAPTVIAIAMALGACGGSGGSRPDPSTPHSPMDPEKVLEMHTAAFTRQACNAAQDRFIPTVQAPAKNQGTCSSCWAHVTTAAYEQNYVTKFGKLLDVSEAQILACSNQGTCNDAGVWAFNYLQSHGGALKQKYQPAADGSCVVGNTPVRAMDRGIVNDGSPDPVAPVALIKAAICAHGAVASAVVETDAFKMYGGGVFSENATGPPGHAVVIVGWDNAVGGGAWRVRNSRGTGWGENGYMWITYGSNRIGHSATWVEAAELPASELPSNPPCPPGTLVIDGGTTVHSNCQNP